jgi:hypothetical protein
VVAIGLCEGLQATGNRRYSLLCVAVGRLQSGVSKFVPHCMVLLVIVGGSESAWTCSTHCRGEQCWVTKL